MSKHPDGVPTVVSPQGDPEIIIRKDESTKIAAPKYELLLQLLKSRGRLDRIGESTTSGTFFMKYKDQQTIAICKPYDETTYARNNPDRRKIAQRYCFPCFFGRTGYLNEQSHLSEVAASVLDLHCGTNVVPLTGLTFVSDPKFSHGCLTQTALSCCGTPTPGKLCSAQLFASDYVEAKGDNMYGKFLQTSPLEIHPATLYSAALAFQKFVILDFVSRNTDRGMSNYLFRFTSNGLGNPVVQSQTLIVPECKKQREHVICEDASGRLSCRVKQNRLQVNEQDYHEAKKICLRRREDTKNIKTALPDPFDRAMNINLHLFRKSCRNQTCQGIPFQKDSFFVKYLKGLMVSNGNEERLGAPTEHDSEVKRDRYSNDEDDLENDSVQAKSDADPSINDGEEDVSYHPSPADKWRYLLPNTPFKYENLNVDIVAIDNSLSFFSQHPRSKLMNWEFQWKSVSLSEIPFLDAVRQHFLRYFSDIKKWNTLLRDLRYLFENDFDNPSTFVYAFDHGIQNVMAGQVISLVLFLLEPRGHLSSPFAMATENVLRTVNQPEMTPAIVRELIKAFQKNPVEAMRSASADHIDTAKFYRQGTLYKRHVTEEPAGRFQNEINTPQAPFGNIDLMMSTDKSTRNISRENDSDNNEDDYYTIEDGSGDEKDMEACCGN